MNTIMDENIQICKQKGWDRAPIHKVWLLFTEEIGELASAIRQSQGLYRKAGKMNTNDVSNEMGDVFSYLFQIAYMMNIDLDHMWEIHKQKMVTKIYAQY
jgi:NTP pyrophosphatase (non-canonical NTP hydrolase)